MHNFSKKKKVCLYLQKQSSCLFAWQLLPYNGWLWGNVAGTLSWWMCCTADFFTYFHKMIGTSECTCMCLCVCQYVCNTIHARSATKVLLTFRHCFDVEQPGFQVTTSRYIYTYLTNGVLLVFYDFDTPL